MRVDKTYTVEQRGVGKPDYSKEISAGQIRPGFELKYSQTLLVFLIMFSSVASAYSWAKDPLAAGATVSLVDGMTGDDLPYTVPLGYTLAMISAGIVCNQDIEVWQLLKVPPIPIAMRELCLTQLAGGTPFYLPEVVAFSSALFDPLGSISFDYDVQVTNKGEADMEGMMGLYMILEKVGSPLLPPTKTVRCKWCGATKEMPIEASTIICDECGKLFIVYPLRQPKGMS